MSRQWRSLPWCFLVLIAVLIVACSGDSGTSPTPPAGTQSDACSATAASIQQVFVKSCVTAGCHAATAPAAGLDLASGDLMTLVGASSALCADWALVVPGSPEKSLLYEKLAAAKPACGDSMPVGARLPAAQIQCVADWIRSLASAGCETCGGSECVSTVTDPAHCGSCHHRCPNGVACDGGVCACPQGASACAGACVDTSRHSLHCGDCDIACDGGAACVGGTCTCSDALSACGSACVDLGADPAHCGACNRACKTGEVCRLGACADGCGELTECSGACVDLQTNVLSCGGCDNACPPALACSGGKCVCPNGSELCGSECVDTQADARHCGGCGVVCGAGESCVAGRCSCQASSSVSFANDVAPILEGACTAAGCHAGMKPKEELSLLIGKSYTELVNVTAQQCGGARKLVVPGSPSESYLMQKMLGIDVCTGTQMPKAGQSLPQNQLDTIGSWICAGALNN